ncbi:hypothetical protein CEXT_61191 [Caerostris extrusa]|uniref:Uncharacterized protein n=1 Tax=Caerostris extrusa TaxID=172846 RepID=A0AAV4SL72_CAEEX|nr:hypothetical protein CEXT_61191 [Caerostris extrusa]
MVSSLKWAIDIINLITTSLECVVMETKEKVGDRGSSIFISTSEHKSIKGRHSGNIRKRSMTHLRRKTKRLQYYERYRIKSRDTETNTKKTPRRVGRKTMSEKFSNTKLF